MSRSPRLVTALAVMVPALVFAQHSAPAGQAKAAPAKMTDAQKIANAMSGGPSSISKNATIMDFPDSPMAPPRQLRAGTNGWICFPASPPTPGTMAIQDPSCLDKAWQAFFTAFMSKNPLPAGLSGIAYMLRGDRGASNVDPFAEAPTPTNQWVVSPGHVMLLLPDPKALDAYPTDPKSGGPWVMWKGTPYAHVMVPVSAAQAATMK